MGAVPRAVSWVCAFALCARPGAAQEQALPLGEVIEGRVSEGRPGVFTVTAPTAGYLTVVVRAFPDVSITVLDEADATVPGGYADEDLHGEPGSEQLVASLPAAGTFTVEISSVLGESGVFRIGATFLATALAADDVAWYRRGRGGAPGPGAP